MSHDSWSLIFVLTLYVLRNKTSAHVLYLVRSYTYPSLESFFSKVKWYNIGRG